MNRRVYNPKLQRWEEEKLIESEDRITIVSLKNRIEEYKKEEEELEEKIKKKREELNNIKRVIKEEAENERKRIIEYAKQEADRIRATVKEEVERGYREGFNSGFKEGEEKGLKSGEAKLRSLWEEGLKFLSQARSLHDDSIKQSLNDIVNLAFVIAEKIIRRAAKEDRDFVKRTVVAAIELLKEAEEIRILVNPDDKSALEEVVPDVLVKLRGIKGVKLEEDKGVGKGECKIETNYGRIDGTIISQLIELANQLT